MEENSSSSPQRQLAQQLQVWLRDAARRGKRWYEAHTAQPRDVFRRATIAAGMSESNVDLAYPGIWILSWDRPKSQFEQELAALAAQGTAAGGAGDGGRFGL